MTLVPLPPQPAGVPWPTTAWPRGDVPAAVKLAPLLDEIFDDEGPLARTYACVVIHRGRLVAERYAGAIDHFDREPEPVTETTPLLSWSMAKSMLHAVVGMLVAEGRLDLGAAAAVPGWDGDDDLRGAITLEHLLCMRDGLDFLEDYVDATRSDVIEMLFGAGAGDVAAFAADRGGAAPPDTRFNYSSGTSNIVSGIVARVVGAGAPYERFVSERLFAPVGMTSAVPKFDAAGTWIASSYVHATAQDFARFGYLYLRDGVWDGTRVLPDGWVDHARRIRSHDEVDGTFYGAHWWVVGDEYGSWRASGYEGQSILLCPALDLVVVRLGKTDASRYPLLADWRRRVVTAFASTG
ncbi:MAG TPA: serine hydrolase [Acidimicrobiales bacterium]|nr:serine hydrolase [Acidimicrobiales bacterium]